MDDKREKIKKAVLEFSKELLPLIISTVITVLFCINSNIVWGNLGFLNVQIDLADEARRNNEYSESINWYEKIAKSNEDYAPYAHLAMAEIYSLELRNKNYDKALEEYKLAICKNNVEALNSAMHFIVQQIILRDNNNELSIDFLDNENISFVVDVMNRLNEATPNRFSSLPIEFPINEDDAKYIFSNETKFCVKNYEWKYISTITDTASNVAYTNDTDKVILVDCWEELTDPLSFSTIIIYKYYHYKKTEVGSYEISSIIAVRNKLDTQKPIELKELHFE